MFRNLFALALNTVMCIYKNAPCSEDLSPPGCRWGFRPQTLWLSLLINPPFQNPRSATVNCCKKTRIQSRQTELFPGYRARCTVLQSSPRYCTFKYRHQYRRQFSFCLKSSTNIPTLYTQTAGIRKWNVTLPMRFDSFEAQPFSNAYVFVAVCNDVTFLASLWLLLPLFCFAVQTEQPTFLNVGIPLGSTAVSLRKTDSVTARPTNPDFGEFRCI